MNHTNTFKKRYDLSTVIINRLSSLFDLNEIEIIPNGVEDITDINSQEMAFVNTVEANLNHDMMKEKFKPDFIIRKKRSPEEWYYLEVKYSVTPLWANKNLDEIRQRNPDIKLCDIGVCAREPWYAYNNLFPNTIILYACSYNPRLFMAQFIKKIQCLRCHDWDCSDCPVQTKELVNYSKNLNSTGSGTPHTNINLACFENVKEFFEKIGIKTSQDEISNIKNIIKAKGVNLVNMYPGVAKRVLDQLRQNGCTWL